MVLHTKTDFINVSVCSDEPIENFLDTRRWSDQRLKNQANAKVAEINAGKLSFGAAKEIRTPDTALHTQDISQMSYSDFINFNYGRVYQRYHNGPGSVKVKIA
ncbi:hypothetical protein [Pontibacter sp. H249]|uniref:hypothetical protein n=1 Tax=Pontibacter sp. H249 TaxID=3133420 RepID=UPI0030C49945